MKLPMAQDAEERGKRIAAHISAIVQELRWAATSDADVLERCEKLMTAVVEECCVRLISKRHRMREDYPLVRASIMTALFPEHTEWRQHFEHEAATYYDWSDN